MARLAIFLIAAAFSHAAVVVIDLARGADRQWIGSAIFPGLGAKGIPLTAIAVKEAERKFNSAMRN
jgi:hypothetical protein